ncbi:MAG: hypothetical protein AB1497_09675 [Bacillota bacterium]
MDWGNVPELLSVLEFRGLVVSFLMTAFIVWIVIRGRLSGQWKERVRRALFLVLVATGAAAFLPSIANVQVPLQRTVSAWVLSNVASANPLVIYAPAVLVSGVVQESTKLLIAVLAFRMLTARHNPLSANTAITLGVYVGAGYGGFEAWLVLSYVFGAVAVPAASIAVSALERLAAVAFHVGVAGLVWYFWYRGTVLTKILSWLGGSLYHSLLNYGIVLLQAGVFSITALYFFLMVGSGAAVYYLRRRLVMTDEQEIS